MRTVAHGARDNTLAGRVLIMTGAGSRFLHVGAYLIVLTAVHDGEDIPQPIAERPMVKEGMNVISQIVLKVVNDIVFQIESEDKLSGNIKDVTRINQGN